ncbi:hypothetical protein HK104_009438 [Borealophlyctis nickersoniae]|nr:hypothetical protein HK104_009438 [Borealophlyctis nickersoniae]
MVVAPSDVGFVENELAGFGIAREEVDAETVDKGLVEAWKERTRTYDGRDETRGVFYAQAGHAMAIFRKQNITQETAIRSMEEFATDFLRLPEVPPETEALQAFMGGRSKGGMKKEKEVEEEE